MNAKLREPPFSQISNLVRRRLVMKGLSCVIRVGQHQSFSSLSKVVLGLAVVLVAGNSARAQQSPQATPLPQSTPFAGPSPSVATPPRAPSIGQSPLVSPSPPVSLITPSAQG